MGDEKLKGMDDHELLVELVKSQRKDALGQRITAFATLGIFVAVAIALCIIVPKVTSTIDQVQATITETQTLVADTQSTISNIDTMVSDVDSHVVENTESVGKAMESINGIDFDTLNQGIEDLAAAVEPLAKFAEMFK